MKPSTLIFDLDGTLLDTITDLADCCNLALKSADLPSLQTVEYKLHVGSGARNLVESAAASAMSVKYNRVVQVSELASDFVDSLYGVYNKAYAVNWSAKTAPYAGIEKLLKDLRAAGYVLAVLSNKPDVFTKQMVDHYFAEGTFDIVFGMKDPWPLKPDPALTLHICETLNTAPDRAVLIGDSGSDMETAVRAGILAYGVLWGFRGKDELVQAGADMIYDNVTELGDWLLHNEKMN